LQGRETTFDEDVSKEEVFWMAPVVAPVALVRIEALPVAS
jgi:hypothetical protein